MSEREKYKKICSCGTSFQNFLDTGLFGCEKCYETFEEELLPIVKNVQGSERHYDLGQEKQEVPLQNPKSNLEQLRTRYHDFVRAGNFEDADKIAKFLKAQREEMV